MWTKMGLSDYWSSPPPRPQIAKDVNVFHIWKTYYLLFFFVVLMSPVCWGLHGTLIPLDSTYSSPGPPKIKKKLITNFFHQITSIFYMLLRMEDSFGVTSISKFSWGLEAYIKNVYEFCWPMYTDLGWPWGYICGCRATKQSSFNIIQWPCPVYWMSWKGPCYTQYYVGLCTPSFFSHCHIHNHQIVFLLMIWNNIKKNL